VNTLRIVVHNTAANALSAVDLQHVEHAADDLSSDLFVTPVLVVRRG
jgi:hypothetical protein